ncbi:hypothetical protein E2C01_012539 [Portunus trituberculatus]|uniref:Uncharacterized protein n=1 Tax=Portunus trituberculatus TaxID=210409 RepID=A0A5B7DEH2_PORTR|nr:hypothetical protein [Portunus trituberculatus]
MAVRLVGEQRLKAGAHARMGRSTQTAARHTRDGTHSAGPQADVRPPCQLAESCVPACGSTSHPARTGGLACGKTLVRQEQRLGQLPSQETGSPASCLLTLGEDNDVHNFHHSCSGAELLILSLHTSYSSYYECLVQCSK